jgi:hypothetical protein
MILLFSSIFLFSCKGSKSVTGNIPDNTNDIISTKNIQASPPAIVYKTVANYNNHVPVIMNEERTEILSYPDPSDVGDFSLPTLLTDGYLLDNRGISEGVAFLTYTYEEYGQLSRAPALAELKSKILDKYPLLELIYCGNRYTYTNPVEELNALIISGFKGCRRANIPKRQP